MASSIPVSSSKRRRSRVSWMVECSPHITTSRGSSSKKARRSLPMIKTDLDSMFDDIPINGSPLPLKLIRDLNIESPVDLCATPVTRVDRKESPTDDVQGVNICTNLMSLLDADTPGRDETIEYNTPLVKSKSKCDRDIFRILFDTPTAPESPSSDIKTPFKKLTLKKRGQSVMLADEKHNSTPLRTTAPPSIAIPQDFEFGTDVQPHANKKRKVDITSHVKVRSTRMSTKSIQNNLRRSRRLSQAFAL